MKVAIGILTWFSAGLALIAFLGLLCRYHEEIDQAGEWFYNLARRGK